jgi:ureidoglycolate hydrolase
MDDRLVEICEYTGIGYKPLVDYGDWRVAILRYIDELKPDIISAMERHLETDEVFVLLSGQAVLFIGGNAARIDAVAPQVMQAGKLYNVKKDVWHTVVLSGDATILLVENRNTGRQNTEYQTLQPEQRAFLVETSRREQPDWWK